MAPATRFLVFVILLKSSLTRTRDGLSRFWRGTGRQRVLLESTFGAGFCRLLAVIGRRFTRDRNNLSASFRAHPIPNVTPRRGPWPGAGPGGPDTGRARSQQR